LACAKTWFYPSGCFPLLFVEFEFDSITREEVEVQDFFFFTPQTNRFPEKKKVRPQTPPGLSAFFFLADLAIFSLRTGFFFSFLFVQIVIWYCNLFIKLRIFFNLLFLFIFNIFFCFSWRELSHFQLRAICHSAKSATG
jgi:hypothetical protein